MSQTGSRVLTRTEILDGLKAGAIFRPGTWSDSSVRAAGYDLRMADDLMVVPGESGGISRRYRAGERRQSTIILNPGQSAFVSSAEQLCIPRDVVAQIGQKFALVSQGMLTLTGMLVDPGYGLDGGEGGGRLHFLLANVGPRAVALQPGSSPIASLMFFRLDEEQPAQEIHSIGFKEIDDALLSDGGAGIAIFQHMTDLGVSVGAMAENMKGYEKRLMGIETGSTQVVMFGLYLVCVTILGASIATLFAIAANEAMLTAMKKFSTELPAIWPAGTVILLAIVGAAGLLTRAVRWFAEALKKRKVSAPA